jgi:hypothetical protein
MKKRILAIILAGVLVFSQSGAVLAADNSAEGEAAAEMTAPETEEESGEAGAAEAGQEETQEAEEEAAAQDSQVLLIPVGIIQGNTCDRDVKIVPCPMILINALVVLRILDVQLCLSVLPYLLRSDTHTSPEVNDLRCGAHNIDLDHMIFNLDAVQFGMQPDRKSGKIRLILLTEVYPERIQGIAAGIVAYI